MPLSGQNRIIGGRLIRGATAHGSPVAGQYGRRPLQPNLDGTMDVKAELPSFMGNQRARAAAYRIQ